MKIHYFSILVAIVVVGIFSISGETALAQSVVASSTVSSNQLCPRGGYTCTVLVPPILSGYIFTEDLYEGIQGQDVLLLQYYLNRAGFFDGPYFGFFGTSTKKAVIDMQRSYGITPAKGYFGPKTRATVNAINRLFK